MVQLLELIDDRQRNSGDYRMTAYLEQKESGKDQIAYELPSIEGMSRIS